jgi:peptidoglycan/LPS O-acetylase OafA/YrhL
MSLNKRYIYLDGIRGIAAIFVLIRHTTDLWNFSFFRSYLAVDIFFLLSGFVIAQSYESKLLSNKLSPIQFIKIRLARIYPLYLLSLLFCIALILQEKDNIQYSIILSIALTLFILPSKIDESPSLFPLNGPYWSLFFELIVNAIYGILFSILSNKFIKILLLIFGILIFGVAWLRQDLDVGHTWSIGSIAAGFTRASFGILFGIFISRNIDNIKKSIKYSQHKFAPWIAITLLILILSSPSFGNLDSFIDAFIILAIFPIILIYSSEVNNVTIPIFTFLGSTSYGLYVFHTPLYETLKALHNNSDFNLLYHGPVFLIFSLLICHAIDLCYDRPIRKYLNKLITPKK